MRPSLLYAPLVLAGLAACAATDPSARGAHLAAARRVTFLHVGFGAGPVMFTDAAGALLEERRVEPFGAALGAPNLIARDLNALNKRTEATTGWSDHGARWMMPETARWATADPPVEGPDAKQMNAPWRLHPYQYVDQNPIVYWDADGRQPVAIAAVEAMRQSIITKTAFRSIGTMSWTPATRGDDGRISETSWNPIGDRFQQNDFASAMRWGTWFGLEDTAASARMDSFEFVMYAGIQSRVASRSRIQAVYEAINRSKLSARAAFEQQVKVGAETWSAGQDIPEGHLVFFEGGPVALSLGISSDGMPWVIGLWPSGSTSSSGGVQTATVDELQLMQRTEGPSGPVLSRAKVWSAPAPW